MYYEPSTGSEFATTQAFRMAYPDTSFGDLGSEADLNAAGLYSIVDARPSYDPELEVCAPTGIVKAGEKWTREYSVTPRSLTPDEYKQVMLRRYDEALTAHLDATAQSKRYADRITCAVRAGFPGPFQQEGIAFAQWMDSCNALGYQIMDEVQSGSRPLPSIEEFVGMMPPMDWPT